MSPTFIALSLYDRDFLLWAEDTVNKLRANQFDDLDIENLIEEIEDLGRSQRRELKSRLGELLEPILKRTYVKLPDCYRGWLESILKQRKAIEDLLLDSPSLRPYFAEIFEPTYQYALKIVRNAYPHSQFPDPWPFERNTEAILTVDFWTE